MLDLYKDSEFYKYATNLENFFHIYLFEVDSVQENYPLILAFAKMMVCKNRYTNDKECNDCNICYLIEQNTYSDLRVIEPDGTTIKKEQVLALQKDFSMTSMNDNNRVYIIKNAEKMSNATANSMLKFIEEPVPLVYGILVTNDRNKILPTILSRACIITLKSENKKDYNLEDIKRLVSFITFFDSNKEETIPYLKDYFFNYYMERNDILKAFDIMEYILEQAIILKYDINSLTNDDFSDIIRMSFLKIDLNKIIYYVNVITDFKSKLLNINNININLFMDRLIIELAKVGE